MPVIARYAAVTVPPMLLLILAATAWGGFAWVALLWLTLVATLADRLLQPPAATPTEEETAPWSDTLSVALAVGHWLVLLATTGSIAAGNLTLGQGIALFFASASFMGQVSHPNAHELIHRRVTILRALGASVYTSVGFGHHVSAHRLVHHRHVGTSDDPNTPEPGESFYSYLRRAWRGSFEAGIVAEIDRLDRRNFGPNHISNPYWLWIGGAVATFILVIALGGPFAGVVLVGLGALTGAQILMSDYVQHYGLQRLILPSGRLEPVAAHHSWNAPRGFSSYLMMNAPAHSEHHMHPDRPYDRLDPQADAPTLPLSMPVMAMIALVPSLWQRMMDKRALKVMEAAEARHLAAEKAPKAAPAPAAKGQAAPTPTPQAQAKAQPDAPSQTPLPDDPETSELLAQIRAATS
jgi:alkane 1-monooxygenase